MRWCNKIKKKVKQPSKQNASCLSVCGVNLILLSVRVMYLSSSIWFTSLFFRMTFTVPSCQSYMHVCIQNEINNVVSHNILFSSLLFVFSILGNWMLTAYCHREKKNKSWTCHSEVEKCLYYITTIRKFICLNPHNEHLSEWVYRYFQYLLLDILIQILLCIIIYYVFSPLHIQRMIYNPNQIKFWQGHVWVITYF